MSKKYYWLKLKNDFFNQREIKKLRKIAGGDTFTIIYLKMQLLSIKNGGIIEFEKTENHLDEQLALELDESLENVRMTMQYLHMNALLESFEDGGVLLNKVPSMIGSETDSAERMRKLRAKKTSQCDALPSPSDIDVTKCDTEIEIEIEKEIYTKEEYDAIRKLYPGTKTKATADKKLPKLIKMYGAEQMLRTVERYKDHVSEQRKSTFPDLKYLNESTFWNGRYVDYLDENYEDEVEEIIEDEEVEMVIKYV